MSERVVDGWWPYVTPYLSFLVVVEVGQRTPDSLALPMLALKPLVPAALLVWFALRGAYPELRGFRWKGKGPWLDLAVGLGTALLWMAPYVLIPALRPDLSAAFDPEAFGAGREVLALGLRLSGFALVTPLFEELFIRSFVMRQSEIFPGPEDFRDVPLARFRWRSFIASCVIFTVAHVPWEWWVALPWVALTNLWFFHRRHLVAVILVHAAANAAIFWLVVLCDGGAAPLWFFL